MPSILLAIVENIMITSVISTHHKDTVGIHILIIATRATEKIKPIARNKNILLSVSMNSRATARATMSAIIIRITSADAI